MKHERNQEPGKTPCTILNSDQAKVPTKPIKVKFSFTILSLCQESPRIWPKIYCRKELRNIHSIYAVNSRTLLINQRFHKSSELLLANKERVLLPISCLSQLKTTTWRIYTLKLRMQYALQVRQLMEMIVWCRWSEMIWQPIFCVAAITFFAKSIWSYILKKNIRQTNLDSRKLVI